MTAQRLLRSFLFTSLVALSGSALLAGCKKADDATPPPPTATKVDSSQVTELEAPQYLRVTGSLRGLQQTDLAANVAGRVTETKVERGDDVKKGQLLARVDTRAAALALAEAKVAVETSKTQREINETECKRYETLHQKGAITELEYDQVTAKCKTAPLNEEAAKARQSIAAKNVGDGNIAALFDGVVIERFVDVGDYVQSSSRVVSLAQIDTLRLEFSVPEANWTDVKKDADVSFRVAAYGDQIFHGKVRFVPGAVRETTRDLMVEALVENPGRKLLPGMFAEIELAIGSRKLPAVPKTAVFEQNGKLNVFVIAEGHLVQRVLQPQRDFQGFVPVVTGVVAGEKVVTTYSNALSNGQLVN
ncbi:MAG TPA: efflux RND transporter periplasmic adaptor subunit [Polyangiaceae bacterium]|nr:efflux RND transporter periplasmic adaptor subunit [Polyangiaceae bacterium]